MLNTTELRATRWSADWGMKPLEDAIQAAADEIDRLSGINSDLVRDYNALLIKLARTEEENERLRKANLDLDTDLAWEQTK